MFNLLEAQLQVGGGGGGAGTVGLRISNSSMHLENVRRELGEALRDSSDCSGPFYSYNIDSGRISLRNQGAHLETSWSEIPSLRKLNPVVPSRSIGVLLLVLARNI